MGECEEQSCEAKESREQDYLPEMTLMSGNPADDERLCFHGCNLRHALSVRHGPRTKRNANCQTGPKSSVKPIASVGEKTHMTIRVGQSFAIEACELIPSAIDQNRCAHWRNPMDMIRQG
jgi:hypothetical protein